MHPNETLIRDFYAAFAKRDAGGMAACYHADIAFSDPAFLMLRGAEAAAMWAMLCARGKDLEIILGDVKGDADGGSAHWEAKYTFSQTGRFVHNKVGQSIGSVSIEHIENQSILTLLILTLLIGADPIDRRVLSLKLT